MDNSDFDLAKFPAEREIVVDAGYLGSGRHIIYALLEVDVTETRRAIKELSSTAGNKISFTAFIVASFAQAIEKIPQVHSFIDWRRRLVTFYDVDVVTMIEPEVGKVAIPNIICAANRKTVVQICSEIRSIQSRPYASEQAGTIMKIAPRMPRFVRLLFFRILKLNPHRFKQMPGTVVLTSVGMFGKGGGWGIGFLPTHNLGITVGGISQKPGLKDGEIVVREYLDITLSFDHDIIDGAPAARVASVLTDFIEAGVALES
ncbi:MAG: 2-oxo acid dehydrogenase subunit E2 [Anaerolineales bacterium]|nr:2-oxo acid dehydrogenase subunit E2 [Anaerolineales bacterium]